MALRFEPGACPLPRQEADKQGFVAEGLDPPNDCLNLGTCEQRRVDPVALGSSAELWRHPGIEPPCRGARWFPDQAREPETVGPLVEASAVDCHEEFHALRLKSDEIAARPFTCVEPGLRSRDKALHERKSFFKQRQKRCGCLRINVAFLDFADHVQRCSDSLGRYSSESVVGGACAGWTLEGLNELLHERCFKTWVALADAIDHSEPWVGQQPSLVGLSRRNAHARERGLKAGVGCDRTLHRLADRQHVVGDIGLVD